MEKVRARKYEDDLPVHGHLHFVFVVGNRGVDFGEGFPEFGTHVPAQGAANLAGAEDVEAVGGVAHHDGEVFGDVVEEDVEGVCDFEIGFGV